MQTKLHVKTLMHSGRRYRSQIKTVESDLDNFGLSHVCRSARVPSLYKCLAVINQMKVVARQKCFLVCTWWIELPPAVLETVS